MIQAQAPVNSGNAVAPQPTGEKPVLTISGVINHLHNDGMTRKEINTMYGLSSADAKVLWQHPKLKKLRTKKTAPVNFTLVDDTEGEVEVPAALQQAMSQEVTTETGTPWAEGEGQTATNTQMENTEEDITVLDSEAHATEDTGTTTGGQDNGYFN